MPKIPEYRSDSNLKVNVDLPQMGLGAVNASERTQEGVINSIRGIEETLTKITDFRQTSEAHAVSFEGLQDITSRADQDTDFDSSKYESEIDRLGQDAAKHITGQLAKEEFMNQFNKQATATKWEIKNSFRKRELEAGFAANDWTRKQIAASFPTMSDAEKIQSVATFKQMLVDGVNNGIYTKGQADIIDQQFQQDINASVVNHDIMTNPGIALTGLEDGKDGPYPGISDQFRDESIQKAKDYKLKYEKEADYAQKQKINSNEDNIVTRMIDPSKQPPTEGEIFSLMNNGDLSPKFAKAVVENIRSAKKIGAETKNNVFNKIALDILNPDKKEDEIKTELLNKNAIGELSDNDFKVLNTFFQSATKEVVEKSLPKKNWLERLFNDGKDKGLKQEIIANMFKSYMQRVTSGEAPEVVATDIIRKNTQDMIVKKLPSIVNSPKGKGQLMIDSQGNKAIVYPDGTIEEAK
jgi:hypothetical protein